MGYGVWGVGYGVWGNEDVPGTVQLRIAVSPTRNSTLMKILWFRFSAAVNEIDTTDNSKVKG